MEVALLYIKAQCSKLIGVNIRRNVHGETSFLVDDGGDDPYRVVARPPRNAKYHQGGHEAEIASTRCPGPPMSIEMAARNEARHE